MPRKRIDINWDREVKTADLKPALKRYGRYLEDIGLRDSTIESYVLRVGKYLEFAQTDAPSLEDFAKFREKLHDERLSRSSLNNYSFAIKGYHQMRGQSINFPFVKPINTIPYFFDENDIDKLFSVCHNLKHLAMLQTLFYGVNLYTNSC